MSDPPPKKVGSLRDRIAAFENKGGTPAPAAAPPAPRPKPGGISWKPKAPSPPSSPGAAAPTTPDEAPAKRAGMSAADAKESIGLGGSLRDRMAALQGKAAFGAPAAPPPKPTGDKPKWKPPPVVPVAPAIGDDGEDDAPAPAPAPVPVVSPPLVSNVRALGEEDAGSDAPPVVEDQAPAEEGEKDPEDEERERRAAIAARMARLGGARIGMGPPVVGRKPEAKKSEPTPEPATATSEPAQAAPKDEAEKPAEAPPATSEDQNDVAPPGNRTVFNFSLASLTRPSEASAELTNPSANDDGSVKGSSSSALP
jgi:hypothetical protein